MKKLDWLISELGYAFAINEARQDEAEGFIKATERELKREVSDMEARVILAESGKFPEVSEDLRLRAIAGAEEEITKGVLMNKPNKVESGQLLLRTVVLGRKRIKEGD